MIWEPAAVCSLAWSSNGTILASGSRDGTVRFWDPLTGECGQQLRVRDASTANEHLYSLAFSPDGVYLAGGTYHGFRLWDCRTGEGVGWFDNQPKEGFGDIFSLAFDPDGKRLTCIGPEGICRVLEIPSLRVLLTLSGHTTGEYGAAVAVMPGGRTIVTGASDRTIRLWDARSGESKGVWQGAARPVRALAVASDGQLLAYGMQWGGVGVLRADAFAVRPRSGAAGAAVRGLARSADGARLATYDEGGTVVLWDVRAAQPRHTLQGHSEAVTAVAFDPPGAELASSSYDGTLRLWSAETGACLKSFTHGWNRGRIGLRSVVFGPRGKTLAACGNVYVWVWDRATGELLHTLSPRPEPGSPGGHSESVHEIAHSRDGAVLFAFHNRHMVDAWTVADGAPMDRHEAREVLVAGPGGGEQRADEWYLMPEREDLSLEKAKETVPVAWLPGDYRHAGFVPVVDGLTWAGVVPGQYECLFFRVEGRAP
jgi:WD40 repeat protein